MADYVISPPNITALPVASGGLFPVGRVFCVGRNYVEHARETGSDPDREPPFSFMKPADALLLNGADMPYPPRSKELVKLAPGDLIYTGTPENIAAVEFRDLLEGVVEGVGSVRTRIV
ncbi:MAG TPA: fumarylacetoacetate hydrolase family protein [Rhodopila sp.]|jgi:2-keto-4-pentenoate hydratase/2-oxohepta-3-ene-1,7-dioic acid hydratase in catechol pathway